MPRSPFKKQKFNHKQAVKCSSISFESLASTAIVCHQIRWQRWERRCKKPRKSAYFLLIWAIYHFFKKEKKRIGLTSLKSNLQNWKLNFHENSFFFILLHLQIPEQPQFSRKKSDLFLKLKFPSNLVFSFDD